MSWSNYISATSTLANSAPWFLAMFEEFKIYLYIGAGVALAFGMIVWLVRRFDHSVDTMARPTWIGSMRSKGLGGMGIRVKDGSKWRDV